MERSSRPIPAAGAPVGRVRPGQTASLLAGVAALGFALTLAPAASAQPNTPYVPDAAQRSGLLMRFAGTPTFLPPDARRDNFYWTRYGDRGTIGRINWFRSQGLYGLGWKAPDTESIYPFWYGSPGQSTVSAASKPWPRPLRFFQGLVRPFRPVGMYYQMGSYVPIYDLDPIAPGPGPYPIPWFFNFDHGG